MSEAILVRQRTPHDCAICSTAMFAGVPYGQVVLWANALVPEFDPLGPMNSSIILAVLSRYRRPVVSTHFWIPDRPAIVNVLSTRVDWGHVVFWDGSCVWDPSPSPFVDQAWFDTKSLSFIQAIADLGPLMAMGLPLDHCAQTLTDAMFENGA